MIEKELLEKGIDLDELAMNFFAMCNDSFF